MRMAALTILAAGMILAATPAAAQTYDPRYPVCLQTYGPFGGISCSYGSMAQCKSSARLGAGQCITNPYYGRGKRRPY
jgi:hypothetical protein